MLQRTIAGRMNDDIRAQLKLVALGYLKSLGNNAST
jgi:hypothetical protein